MRTPKQALIDSLALFAIIVAAVVLVCYTQLIDSSLNLKSAAVATVCWIIMGTGYLRLIRD